MENSIRMGLAGALLILAQSSFASLLTNGSFESGLTGWSCTTADPDGACTTRMLGDPQDGSTYFIGFDNAAGGLNAQSFSTTVGHRYSVSFFYGGSEPSPTNNLSVEVGDLSQSLFVPADSWDTYSSTFMALSSTTVLSFYFDTDIGSGTVWLDGVVVDAVSVPAPPALALLTLGLAGLAAIRRRSLSA